MVSTLTETVLLTLINSVFLGNNVLSVSSRPYNNSLELDERSFISKRNKKCPPSFTHLSESNKCYRLETDRLEWGVARLRCKGLHPKAHSVVVNDAKENRAIATFIAWRYDTVSLHCYNIEKWMLIWTAGQRTDNMRRSAFVWKLDPCNWMEMKFVAWATGQPDFAGGVESCLHLAGISGNVWWNDHDCSTPMCVLCEIDMEE